VLIEQITYVLHPGKAPALVAAYEQEGAAIIKYNLGHMIAFLQAEVGGMDEVSHLWLFDDAADRETRHAKSRLAAVCADLRASSGQPPQSALAAGVVFAGPRSPGVTAP
jgi:hypothetical protein